LFIILELQLGHLVEPGATLELQTEQTSIVVIGSPSSHLPPLGALSLAGRSATTIFFF